MQRETIQSFACVLPARQAAIESNKVMTNSGEETSRCSMLQLGIVVRDQIRKDL
jgi:hypothetical protein